MYHYRNLLTEKRPKYKVSAQINIDIELKEINIGIKEKAIISLKNMWTIEYMR